MTVTYPPDHDIEEDQGDDSPRLEQRGHTDIKTSYLDVAGTG